MRYLKALLSITLVVCIFFEGFAFLGDAFCAYIDQKYEDQGCLVPSARGNAMGIDYIYSFDFDLKDKISIFGASTSIIGLYDDEKYIFKGKEMDIEKLCCGSADIFSIYILKNYAKEKGASFGVIKFDISPVLFKTCNLNNEVVTSALSFGNVYKVNKDLTVDKTALYDLKEFFIKDVRSIQKLCEYLEEYIATGSFLGLYETSELDWDAYYDLLSFDTYRADLISQFILDNDNLDNIIVDILYESSSQRDSKTGQYFNRYVDEILIPFLEEKGVRYIDSRNAVSDENYIDGIHITKEGQREYTDYVKEMLNGN